MTELLAANPQATNRELTRRALEQLGSSPRAPNLTMWMQLRHLTRLTNGFSKKWENLRAALALHFWNYNFCWLHSTIRCIPAMATGVAREPRLISELLAESTLP